jgi:hypothetical protein
MIGTLSYSRQTTAASQHLDFGEMQTSSEPSLLVVLERLYHKDIPPCRHARKIDDILARQASGTCWVSIIAIDISHLNFGTSEPIHKPSICRFISPVYNPNPIDSNLSLQVHWCGFRVRNVVNSHL